MLHTKPVNSSSDSIILNCQFHLNSNQLVPIVLAEIGSTPQAAALLVLLSILNLPFVADICKTGGVISSCLICSNAFSHFFIFCKCTIKLALNDTCFEWPPATYGQLSLSSPIFHAYFMANLSYAVPSHTLVNFYGYNNT